MTIFNPDDGDVSEIVLPDGSQASKVVAPDGSVVWSAGGEIPDSGGTHQYNTDEGSGTLLTDSIGALDGTINGATWQTGAGAGGAYLDYDGVDDRTQLPGGASEFTHFTNAGTGAFFAWVKFDSLASSNIVFGSTFTTSETGLLVTSQSGSDLRASLFYGSIGVETQTIGTYPASTGEWAPIAVVADASNLTLFAGDPLTQLDTTALAGSTAGDWTTDPYFGFEPFTGDYGDLSIDIPWFDSVGRSQSELQSFVNDSRQFYP